MDADQEEKENEVVSTRWRCPAHYCREDGCLLEADEAKYQCDHCPVAYCAHHGAVGGPAAGSDRVMWLGKIGYVCRFHTKQSIEALVNFLTPQYVFGIGQKRTKGRKSNPEYYS